jgi:hypothetical protein
VDELEDPSGMADREEGPKVAGTVVFDAEGDLGSGIGLLKGDTDIREVAGVLQEGIVPGLMPTDELGFQDEGLQGRSGRDPVDVSRLPKEVGHHRPSVVAREVLTDPVPEGVGFPDVQEAAPTVLKEVDPRLIRNIADLRDETRSDVTDGHRS